MCYNYPMDAKIDLSEYEEIPKTAVVLSKMLDDVYKQLGRPQSMFSDSGKKMMEVIISSWEDLYPAESRAWYEERKTYQKEELTINEQVAKKSGRSLASIPFYVFQMMRIFFPNERYVLSDRTKAIKFVRKYPMFRWVNRI